MLDANAIEMISQAGIVVFGISSIILVAKKNKWGFVVGLIGQPFFLFSTFTHQQWGMFVVAVICTFSWALGIYEWFFKGENKAEGRAGAKRRNKKARQK